MAMTSAQRRAAQLAQLQAEQERYDKAIEDAVENAAEARCKAVEELYELLEVGKTRNDKDGARRAAKLVERVAALVEQWAESDGEEAPTDGPMEAWREEHGAADLGRAAAAVGGSGDRQGPRHLPGVGALVCRIDGAWRSPDPERSEDAGGSRGRAAPPWQADRGTHDAKRYEAHGKTACRCVMEWDKALPHRQDDGAHNT